MSEWASTLCRRSLAALATFACLVAGVPAAASATIDGPAEAPAPGLLFGWDDSVEGWVGEQGLTRVAHDPVRGFGGGGSLAVSRVLPRGWGGLRVNDGFGRIRTLGLEGDVLSVQVYLPEDTPGRGWKAQLEAQDVRWSWRRGERVRLLAGEWTELSLVLNGELAAGMRSLGVQVDGTGAAGSVEFAIDELRLDRPGAELYERPRPERVYGTLQSSPDRLPETTAAGVDLVTLEVYWDRFEPIRGQLDETYVTQLRQDLSRYRDADVDVVLSTGVHYSPAWLLDRPDSRFVNQYGDAYAPGQSGKNVANMVFNQALRDEQARYLSRLFATVGSDFYGVRLGGGWYGELNYPEHEHAGRSNAYWGYDPIALGVTEGLPPGMTPNPAPGWVPGAASHSDEAARFAHWYLESLRNYHDWQIATVRDSFDGRLLMLYPSWGIRPGQLQAAVAADLAGTTSAELNGEIQRGFDVARFVAGISDPGVVVYTTWLNADASADAGDDPRYWSPVQYLTHLATDRDVPLDVMGENTGHDGVEGMDLSFAQAREHGLIGVVWAFEPHLFGGEFATIDQYAAAIEADTRR